MNKKMREACLAVADVFEFAPETFATRAEARDCSGNWVNASDPNACAWCAVGGVMAAIKGGDFAGISDALTPFAVKLGHTYTTGANNYGGRLVAIKMLRLAGGES